MVTRRDLLKSSAATGLLATGVGTSTAGRGKGSVDSFVSRSGTELEVDGETWYFNGTNNFDFVNGVNQCCDLHEQWMSQYADLGFNAVRTWAFLDGTSTPSLELRSFQPEPGEYDEQALDTLDYIVYQARRHGIRLVLPFVDNWPHFGGMDQYVEWSGTAYKHDDFYTDEQCRQWYKQWVEYLLTRENNYTGVEYRNEPAIAIWELANEPEAGTYGTDVLQGWLTDMAAHFKSIDGNHLLSTGLEGFYDREDATRYPYDGSTGTDYLRNHRIDDIDVCTFHLYPKAWNMADEEIVTWIEDHVREAHDRLGKPVYCGEMGMPIENESESTVQQRTEYYREWYDTLERTEANGALAWLVTEDVADKSGGFRIWEDQQRTLDVINSYTQVQRRRSGRPLEGGDDGDDLVPDRMPIVDNCASLDTIDSGEIDALTVDTANTQYFDRADGGTDGARITRDGTTENAWFEYAPAGQIDAVRVAGHEHVDVGGRIEFHEWTESEQQWSRVSTRETTVGGTDGGWISTEYAANLSDGATRFAIQLVGGSEPWGLQIGRVKLAMGQIPGTSEVGPGRFVDDCSSSSAIDSGQVDALTVDRSNTRYFDRQHGGTDGARLTRDRTTENVWFEYAPAGEIESIRVEGHESMRAGGRIEFYEWIESEQRWSRITPRQTRLGTDEGGWLSTEHTADLSDGATRFAIQLTGSSESWGLQVGCVELQTK